MILQSNRRQVNKQVNITTSAKLFHSVLKHELILCDLYIDSYCGGKYTIRHEKYRILQNTETLYRQ